MAEKINWSVFEEAFKPLYCRENGRPAFRHRIGEEGLELIMAESIRINDDHHTGKGDQSAFIDSTVQEKNITYPTDAKLHRKIIKACQQIAVDEKLPVRQSYSRTLKELALLEQRFRNHLRSPPIESDYRSLVGCLRRPSTPRTKFARSTNLRFSASAKVRSTRNTSLAIRFLWSVRGVILGAASFRNQYDGHTIDAALAQVKRLTGSVPELLAGDRGYRGQRESGKTKIVIPSTPLKRDSKYVRAKQRKLFCSRAGIEPRIGHLKSDHRLGRNFYKGLLGDAINVLLAAAAFNFKRALRVLCALIKIRFDGQCSIYIVAEDSS